MRQTLPPRTASGQRFSFWTVVDPGPIYRQHNKRYVEVKCICGIEKEVREKDLLDGETTGCYRCAGRAGRDSLVLPENESVWSYFLNSYIQNAKVRSIQFMLTREQFKTLALSDCHYCGTPPSMKKTYRRGQISVNGVDRVDNTRGYYPENCVSACKLCNRWKGTISEEEFLSHVRRIVGFKR